MALFSYPLTLAFISFLFILAFMPSSEATVCTFLPFLCRTPPTQQVPPPPPPPPVIGGSQLCRFFPLLCRTPPPSSPPPPPPPSVIGGSPFIATFITGTLACPFSSEAPRFILLRNAIVDLRCGSGSSTATSTLLATTTTNDAGNYVISLDFAATSRFDPNSCVLAITSRSTFCLQAQIPSVPLRVLTVDQGVVIATSPIFGI